MKNLFLLSALMLFALDFQAQEADSTIWKNIVLDSVVIMPLPEYRKFIQDIEKMPPKTPYFVPGVSREGDIERIWKKPVRESPPSLINPVSLIYNRFNERERFKRKLERNRRQFNREMERLGADSLMIPERE